MSEHHHVTTLDIQTSIDAFPFWYHKIALPGGVTTPGWAPLNAETYRIPEDMTGMRVLDVGAWDGYWSFEALKRGAKEVVAIDDFSDYLGRLDVRDRAAWETFDLCRDALGHSEDVCKRIELSVYEATEERLGRFDAVFFFGTIYHLRYPLLSLDILSAICDKEIFIESAVLDDYSPYQGGIGRGYGGAQPVMEFYPNTELGGNSTNWWAPSLSCLGLMTMAAGFEDVNVWKLVDGPQELVHCRGFAHGRKK